MQQAVERFKHSYVRFEPLHSQLLADSQVTAHDQEQEPRQQQSALKLFIECTTQGQQHLERLSQRPLANGKHNNGVKTPSAAAADSSLFLRQLQQEVERLRRFVHFSAEDLWMRLLAAADGLTELRQGAASLQSQTQQQQYAHQHQELAAFCDGIGKQGLIAEPQSLLSMHVQHNVLFCL